MSTTNASSVYIDILAVIDTENIKKDYRNPSQDSNNPTGIERRNLYLTGANPRGINSGQGTTGLNFNANPGDDVSFRATSIQQNSDDAVILYKVQSVSGARIFNNFIPDVVTRRQAVMPNPNSQAGIPPVNFNGSFANNSAKVTNKGSAGLYLYFALYTSDDGDSQKLFGYYYCEIDITTD